MLGRGLIANPFLPEMIQSGNRIVGNRNQRFEKFHDDLMDSYRRQFSGPGHVLDRMKGFWGYFAAGFPDGRRIVKRIRKADALDRYRREVMVLFNDRDQWA
jgi:tRNA-dihydrouridine synthase